MIKINVNLEYLTDNYNIGSQQLMTYRGKPLKEVMEIEAQNGNQKAADFNINLLSDPMELVRIFRLMDPENRYLIIKNMNYHAKMKLLSMLETGEMLLGLRFFQKEKLLDMLKDFNKEKIFAVAMQKFNLENFLKLIPEKEMDRFFDQDKIEPEQIMKGVQQLNFDQMAKMVENVTGEYQQNKTKEELTDTLTQMKPEMFKTAVKSLNKEEKAFIMQKMIEDDPNVLSELSKDAFIAPLEQLEKDDLLEAMSILEADDMLTMLSQLPEDLMAVTATQLDPEVLSRMLSSEFPDILSQLCANI